MDRLECDRMFVAVVEARSFTGAAVKLGASSGQASKLVSRLEAELGVRLLNRTTRAVSETEAGRAYFERIRAILDEIDNLDLAIRNVAQTPRGRLRLTAPLTFGTVELARGLRHVPDRQVEVVDLVQDGADALEVGATGFRLGHGAGRPVQQAHAELGFEARDELGRLAGTGAELDGGAGEGAGLHHGDEHAVTFETVHESSLSGSNRRSLGMIITELD